jgi:asparagine synthase (glutamine-hydrolysing)
VSQSGAQVAWVGQCIEDSGDATDEAISLVAADHLDDRVLAQLNGPFAAAVVRQRPFAVRVLTDRHRHYPVYFHRGNSVAVASTEMRCIVPWLDRAQISADSVDMLLRCGELVDRMTMLSGVEMLPPGTVLSGRPFEPTTRRYWAMRSDGAGAALDIRTTARRLGERLRTAVRRVEAITPRLGITLSGGLDSRMILDLCQHPQQVPSYTWGLAGCRDIASAGKFAATVKSRHTIRHWDPGAFPPLWSRGVDLTGGGFGVESMYMLPFVALLAQRCDVVLNGLAGDVILGGNWLKHAWLKERSIERLGRAVWRWRVPQHADRLVDRLTGRGPARSSSADTWTASICAREGATPVERLNDWLVENRIFRTTNSGTMLLRGELESHAPFFDRDFIDSLLGIRQADKYKHRLYLEVMKCVAPRSASIAWQRTNLAPALGYYANLTSMALHKLVTMLAPVMGVMPFKSLMVADPAGWLRGPWRPAVEDILFSKPALQRGLVDSNVTREIWNAHLNGNDLARQLGVLITIELFAREVINGTAKSQTPVQVVREGT